MHEGRGEASERAAAFSIAPPSAAVVLRHQLDANFARLPMVFVGVPLVAAVMTWLFWGLVDRGTLGLWLGGTALVAVSGVVASRAYARRKPESSLRPWANLRTATAALSGLSLGGAMSLMYVPGDPMLVTVIVIAIGGSSVAAISSTSSFFPALATFQVCNVGPFVVRLVGEGDEPHLAIAGLSLLFLLVVLGVGKRASMAAVESIRLAIENEQLVDRLQQTRDELRMVNRELAANVSRRTEDLERVVREKEASEAQLRQSQKMEAVGRLAGGVAHDFNNLLTIIMGFSAFLERRMAKGDPSLEHVEQIMSASERAAALVKQLLTISRGGITEPELFDANKRTRALDQMLRRVLGDNVELVSLLEDQPTVVKMEPTQFDQVLLNLTVNARDAMPNGGSITISVGRHVQSEASVDLPVGPYAKISVRDTGEGIAPDAIDHIFEPFFTTKGEQGTGLGLSTTFGIVKSAGGALRVQSESGAGSCFDVLLPAQQAVVEELGPRATRHGQPSSAVRVLVVEDQLAVLEVTAVSLREHGYSVLEATSAERALDILDSEEPKPDLILTDIMLPRTDGVELYRRVSPRFPGIAFLFMSGFVHPQQAKALVGLGAQRLLRKPFTTAELLDAMQRALGNEASEPDATAHLVPTLDG